MLDDIDEYEYVSPARELRKRSAVAPLAARVYSQSDLHHGDEQTILVTAPECGDRICLSVDALRTAAAIRCPTCGVACSSRSLIDAAKNELLWEIGNDGSGCTGLDMLCEDQRSLMVVRSSSPHSRELPPPALAALREQGLVVCRGSVHSELARECRLEAASALEAAMALPPDESSELLGLVRAPTHRHDVRLSLTPCLRRVLAELLQPGSTIGGLVEQSFGDNALLCELSCIVSSHGAPAQPAHSDTRADDDEVEVTVEGGQGSRGGGRHLLTAFTALQDIDGPMGPTRMWPRSHTAAFHESLSLAGPNLLRAMDSVAMTLRSGDTALMDSRLWHCGGAHRCSTRRRFLLVVTFAAPLALPEGSTYSMLPSLVGKHTLRSLRDVPRDCGRDARS
jgi:hypothetical protein